MEDQAPEMQAKSVFLSEEGLIPMENKSIDKQLTWRRKKMRCSVCGSHILRMSNAKHERTHKHQQADIECAGERQADRST